MGAVERRRIWRRICFTCSIVYSADYYRLLVAWAVMDINY